MKAIADSSFWPDIKNMKEGGRFRAQLPKTTHAAVILFHLNRFGEHQDAEMVRQVVNNEWGNRDFAKWFGLLLTLFLALVTQLAIAFYLHGAVVDVVGDLTEDCSETSTMLQLIALNIFVVSWIKDCLETWHMYLWLSLIEEGQNTVLCVHQMEDTTDGLHPKLMRPHGMSMENSRRWYFYVVGIFSKALVAFIVLISGSGAILRAGDECSLVLNTLAANFVLEVDDLFYAVFVSQKRQFMSGTVPAFGFRTREVDDSWGLWITEKHRLPFSLIASWVVVFFLRCCYWCTDSAPETFLNPIL
mmetsp:Transcript_139440/g.246027  ORF Transcript_139440/g.246027 Transcript_139440/m.246027 type:complete len:302 (+) Transcript_139440:54-959(+)